MFGISKNASPRARRRGKRLWPGNPAMVPGILRPSVDQRRGIAAIGRRIKREENAELSERGWTPSRD
jgi:hypothetical protein